MSQPWTQGSYIDLDDHAHLDRLCVAHDQRVAKGHTLCR
jgi:hypothetical protein